MQKRAPLSKSRTNAALWEARAPLAAAEEQSLIVCRFCLVQSVLHGDGRDGSGGRESFGVGQREGSIGGKGQLTISEWLLDGLFCWTAKALLVGERS